ncbi:hypothetical protein GCK72_007412 [Caenorhabditis remanei]|uniref:BTB domain-containing protein n=1 Tax=Caenorhabditis remanei TaxID=31234 RepID=A0A6A5HM56_CAERE|nr:hypothetical protein GCK72_007412 [Caenorhabditis remanei]KAF1767453.1 hypothetical protein GCK72_007412 [Caenorhabditis remanei]
MSEEIDNVSPTINENDNLVSEEQEVTQETAGNKKENQNTSHNEIVEKMFEKLLEKQKNLEISNTEIVEKLRSVESELQLLRDDMKPKTVTAAVPVKSSNISTTGKYFVLKHVFKNVSSLKHSDLMYSEIEEHFGVPWRILILRSKEQFAIFLSRGAEMAERKMSFDVEYEVKFLSINTRKWSTKKRDFFQNSKTKKGSPEVLEYVVLREDFLADDKLIAEIHVKIEKTAGFYKDNLRVFDETMEEFSDVVLVVNEEKFYVLKKFLAVHSSYFKSLFLGQFQESKKSEITLTGIDADDFQNYLELLYGDNSIDEITVEGILMVADMYDTPLVIRKCEEFLLEKSKKTLKKKLQMSMKYHLEALKKQCLDSIKSVSAIRSVMPRDGTDLDPSIMRELLEKSLALHNPK